MRVLIVDDDPTFSKMLKETLDGYGHVSDLTFDAMSGTQRAIDQHPEVILLDKRIPAGNAFIVKERLARNESTRNIPVIMITGYSTDEDTAQAEKMGFYKVMSKPFTARDLIETLGHIERHEGAPAAA